MDPRGEGEGETHNHYVQCNLMNEAAVRRYLYNVKRVVKRTYLQTNNWSTRPCPQVFASLSAPRLALVARLRILFKFSSCVLVFLSVLHCILCQLLLEHIL